MSVIKSCGFDPRRDGNILKGDWLWNIFYGLLLIQEGQLSVSGERIGTILDNGLEDQGCQIKVWFGKLTALDMTPLGWLGRKTSTKAKMPHLSAHSH